MKYLLIAVLWAVYCALHSFLISTGFTNKMKHLFKKYYAFYRLFYVAVSFILLVPLIRFTNRIDDQLFITYPEPLNIVRYIFIAGSLIMFAWAFFFNYDALSFFGIRQILNLRKENNTPGDIKKNGLLGIIRHPMYLALIVYLWCSIFTLANLIVNSLLTAYVIIGTYLEEKKLVLEFGESYIKYKKEVPMLIPFIRSRSV